MGVQIARKLEAVVEDDTEVTNPGSNVFAYGVIERRAPFDDGWRRETHHQMLYPLTGGLYIEADGARWFIPPRRAAWIRAGVEYRARSREDVVVRRLVLGGELGDGPEPACRVFDVTPLAREMIEFSDRFGPEQETEGVSRSFFETLLGLSHEWVEDTLPLRLPAARSRELARAMGYTLDRLGGNPNIDEAAKIAGLSTRTLARRFHEEARTTWRKFLHDARMIRAMELLSYKGRRITDTACDVGFDSPAAFSRAFEAFTGEKPKDYRRRVAT